MSHVRTAKTSESTNLSLKSTKLESPKESLKNARQNLIRKSRPNLFASTASSRAKELQNIAKKVSSPQKSVVVPVITAASLKKTAASKVDTNLQKPAVEASTTTKNTIEKASTAPTRKINTTRKPLEEDDEDDIYAYYEKKKQRMQALLQSAKPTISPTQKIIPKTKEQLGTSEVKALSTKTKPTTTIERKAVAKPTTSTNKVSISKLASGPETKRKATPQSMAAMSVSKKSSLSTTHK